MIKVNNLTFGYNAKVVLDNISFKIDSNKVTFIIGNNGSGKSSLANILSGLNTKFKGEVLIDDIKISKKVEIKELRQKIGIVFQNPSNQIVFNKVYDDLKFTLENMDIPKSNHMPIIKDTLKIVNMDSFINANPYKLSGGEKQRIALASALLLNPNYLIFDEATSMLDSKGKKDIYELINNLKNKGISVIFITNIMSELIYADDILVIDNKKIYKYTLDDIINDLNILTKHNLEIPFNLKLVSILNNKNIKVTSEEDIIKELELL